MDLCPACRHAMEFPESSAQSTGLSNNISEPKPGYRVTWILIALNVLIFAVIRIAKSTSWGNSVADSLSDFGPYTLSGQWWRLFTVMFLHIKGAHLIDNMLALWFLGKRVERLLGKWTYLLLYITCGVAGDVLSLALHPEWDSNGASGAIFGLVGFLISVYGRKILALDKGTFWKLILLIVWTALSIYLASIDPKIDNAGHIGGLIAGLVLGGLLTNFAGTTKRYKYLLFSTSTILLAAGCALVTYYRHDAAALRTAMDNIDSGKPDKALQIIDAVLKHEPESRLAQKLAATAYLQRGDFDHAEAMAKHILSAKRDDEEALDVMNKVTLHKTCLSSFQLIPQLKRDFNDAAQNEFMKVVNTACNIEKPK